MRNHGRKWLVATALMSGVATLAMVANSLAVASANRQIAAQIAAIPGASVGSVSADLWRGRIVLGNLSFGGTAGTMSATRVELPARAAALALVSPAQALDGAVSIDDLVINGGVISYRIKHIEASGTTMGAAELAAIFDPKSTVPAAERLAGLTAAAIVAPEVVGTAKLGKIEQTVTYKDVKLVNIVAGKIGAASVAETLLAMTDASGAPVAVSIANTTSKGIDLVLISRMMTVARTDANEQLQTIYDKFAADSITFKGEADVAISIGKISGEGFKGRAMAMPYDAMMAELAALADGVDKDAEPSAQKGKTLARGYADMIRSFEIGSVEIRDIVLTAKDKGKPVTFKLARMAMSGLAGGKLGQFAYEGVDLNADEAIVKLGNFSFRGFDFRPLLAMADAFAEKGEEAVQDPAALRSYIPTLDHMGMNNLFLDAAATGDQPGNAAGGKRNRFQLAALSMDMGGFISGVPTNVGMAAEHFSMDLTGLLSQPDMENFAALGYKSIDFSSRFDLGWNEATSELALKNLSTDAAGMGSLRVSATLGNVTKDLFATDTNQQIGALVGILAKNAEVSFINGGLVDKAINMQAVKTKKPAADIRKVMAAGTNAMIPAMLGNSKGATDIAEAVAKFLASSKSLTISAVSPEGLGVGDIGLLEQPQALLEKLQIKAVANQ